MERTNFYDTIYSPVVLLLNAVVVGIVMLLSASGNARILSLFGMSVGTSVAVINYISRIFAPIESLGMEIQTIQSAMAGVRRIDAFLAQPERAMENGETAAYGDVVLSHVTFGYGEAPVLRDFSMTVKQGEQITLGDPQITEEMAKHAARLAGIDAAVQALPAIFPSSLRRPSGIKRTSSPLTRISSGLYVTCSFFSALIPKCGLRRRIINLEISISPGLKRPAISMAASPALATRMPMPFTRSPSRESFRAFSAWP